VARAVGADRAVLTLEVGGGESGAEVVGADADDHDVGTLGPHVATEGLPHQRLVALAAFVQQARARVAEVPHLDVVAADLAERGRVGDALAVPRCATPGDGVAGGDDDRDALDFGAELGGGRRVGEQGREQCDQCDEHGLHDSPGWL
jgi:hypothetical protein